MKAAHPHGVVLVCNEGFLTPALFVAQQLMAAQARRFDVVIVSGEDLSAKVPEGVRFVQVEMEAFTNALPEAPRLKKYTYWRIPAIERLSLEYQRVLYLDADVFINDPSQVERLLAIPMGDCAMAAVRDVHQLTRPHRIAQEHQALGLPTTPYFNAGLLLVQSSRWQALKCFENIRRLTQSHKHLLFCHDQSLLNLVSEGRWLELSPVWNWQYSRKNCLLTEMVSPQIIHFAGAVKLWHAPNGDTPQRYWQAYQTYLQAQGLPSTQTYPASDERWFKVWGLNLLKNLWYFKRYQRYLQRFETPWSTVAHDQRFNVQGIFNDLSA